MTKLTYLYLSSARGLNPEPIPFPSEFCNMIYLKKFIASFNKFTGFLDN